MEKSIVQKEYENGKLKRDDVENLMQWLESQPHLPKMTEHEVIWFLQSCYYSNEMAKKTIDNYFTVKTLCPEILGDRDPDRPIFENFRKTIAMALLPQKSIEGYRIIMTRYLDLNSDKFIFNDFLRYFDMVTMVDLHTNGTNEGYLYCFDMQGITFAHAAKMSLVSVKTFLYYLQEAMPIRLKGLHLINISPVVDKIMLLTKPFMKDQVIKMLHLHTSTDQLKKFVRIDDLPGEYNEGKNQSITVFKEQTDKLLQDNKEFLAYQEKQLVDETKRPGKPKTASDMFGVEGTFKKLELD